LALTGIRTWFGVGIFTATGALAGSVDKGPAVTGAKRLPTSLYDYEIVVRKGFAVLAAMIVLFVLEII
jgi:hypothetical protein